jgi:hypothetical protein
VRSLLAGWRVSLQRTRADWPIVAAAGLITLLAAALLAAGAIYPSAASEAGLRQALADAPVADTSIDVSLFGASTAAAAVDRPVQAELQRVIAPLGGSIVRDWQGSATLALPEMPRGKAGDQAILGFLDGLPDHATLVDGAWPVDRTVPSEPIQVVVVDAVAQELGLEVGEELSLVANASNQPMVVPVRLVGIVTINAGADPYWNGDEQLLGGVRENGQYRTFGPFLTTLNGLLGSAGAASLNMHWRTFPDFERVIVDEAAQLRSRVEALPGRVQAATGEAFINVRTGLPAILRDAERSLLVSRTGVLLLMAQLAVLAAYAIILTASLLVDHRRIDTALLRSRGAGARQVGLLALAEGLLFAIPAVLAAPWLAVAGLRLFNVVGPLADVRLRIVPLVTLDGYLAAGAAGIVCVALLVLPAALAARGFATEQGGLSRQETRTFGQRMGIDVALLAVTGIALWQLRLYGAPLTRTVQGTIGLDPLLVAAPAIGLLAGGVLALRILPLLAQAFETAVARGRGVVLALGSRQLARRPLRYTRSALLLMLAMSMGVFAVSYAATWSTSQRDQAAYQAGADVRALPGNSLGSLPGWALPGAYAGLASVERAMPVERIADGISFAAGGSADLLALDADAAAGIVLFRTDESAEPFGELMQALREGRPDPHLASLPANTAYLRIVPRLDVGSIQQLVFDPETGASRTKPLDPTELADIRMSVNAVVRDAGGLLYGVESTPLPLSQASPALVLPLESIRQRGGAKPSGARLAEPVTLACMGIKVWLPVDTVMAGGSIGVTQISAGSAPAGQWSEVPLASVDAWTARIAQSLGTPVDVPAEQTEGTTVRLAANDEGGLFGNGTSFPASQLSFLPTALATANEAVPVIANGAFLATMGSARGDTITATVEGRTRRLTIAGVVDSFPTTDPARPLLLLDEPTVQLIRLQGTSRARSADEWWMTAATGASDALAGALRGSPFDSLQVVAAADRTRSLTTDPVALGMIGALTIGFVATGLFALVGLTVSAAVSARQRRTEFALLRALGLSGSQLSGSLWLENSSIVLVSLLAGTSLGLLTGWMVLPFVTVTQRAAAPVPPVLVDIPWDEILVLDAVSAVALGVAVVVIGGVLRRLGVGSILRMGED